RQNTVKASGQLSRHILATLRYSTIHPPSLTEPAWLGVSATAERNGTKKKVSGCIGNLIDTPRSSKTTQHQRASTPRDAPQETRTRLATAQPCNRSICLG